MRNETKILAAAAIIAALFITNGVANNENHPKIIKVADARDTKIAELELEIKDLKKKNQVLSNALDNFNQGKFLIAVDAAECMPAKKAL